MLNLTLADLEAVTGRCLPLAVLWPWARTGRELGAVMTHDAGRYWITADAFEEWLRARRLHGLIDRDVLQQIAKRDRPQVTMVA